MIPFSGRCNPETGFTADPRLCFAGGRTLPEVRDAAGHANASITSAYFKRGNGSGISTPLHCLKTLAVKPSMILFVSRPLAKPVTESFPAEASDEPTDEEERMLIIHQSTRQIFVL